ncbi:hypothetical protein SLEP1_g6149 [Rubroshorea leprosula]|uniref:Seipin n=1 Tax=Rubroshorea leprosula TaxID=152421 RepID=A0AAV5I3C7_9ROSI|nr:hypothetical protein SLEP1_g6149 [Rubroshorea leprosula]
MDSDDPTDKIEDDDQFLDTLNDFPLYDCVSDDESDVTTSEASTTTTLRRRKFSHRGVHVGESEDGIVECSITEDSPKTSFREEKCSFYGDSKGKEENFEVIESTSERVNPFRVAGEENDEESTVTTAKGNDPVDKIDESADSSSRAELSESSFSSSNWLVFIAGLVIKAIGFQISLLISLITLPISVSCFCCLFIFNPFQAVRRVRNYVMAKLSDSFNAFYGYVSPLISRRLKEHQVVWKLVLRFGWGLFWAAYVCCVLCGLLISSLVISGFLMRSLVEEPIEIKEMLNFDYTKNSPVAFVPISSCAGVHCDSNCMEKIEVWNNVGLRVIPPDHKLQVTVSLTLPESEYNRNLGIFQVRVDFLSDNGKILASSWHPCMLKFKSEPIRYLLTFLQVAPILSGYISESQILNLKIRGLKEGEVPTACLRVVIEQRAEYRPGAGIPEIYNAFLILDSELPFVKRILWYWKKTIFVWVSITTFIMELLVALICCRPMLIPRTRSAGGSTQNDALQG